jgi:hypothetical protein
MQMLAARRDGSRLTALSVGLSLAALAGGAGCSHPPLLAAPHRFVRLDALLPLNPSWSQVEALDREVARLKTSPSQSGPIRYEPHAALPAFVPRATAPASMAAERAAQVERDAKRYLDSLQKSIGETDRSIMSIERRREQRRVEAGVAARLAEAAAKLRAENAVRSFAIRDRLRTLAFRDIVVKSQVQDLAQAHTRDPKPLREAQNEHAALVAEMDRLKAENRALLTQDIAMQTARQRDAITRDEQAKSRDRLAKRAEDLKSEMQDKIAAAMSRQRDTAIPPPAAPKLPPLDPRTTPLPLPPERGVVLAPAAASVESALNRQAALWQAQRAKIVAEIRADTEKAVQQVALRRGWTLEEAPRPGALDATKEAAEDLRGQWRIASIP